MERPETRYTKVGDGQVAYQVFGSGPVDLVFVQGLAGAIEFQWEFPELRHVYERLASFSRVILFDRRGTGISDGIRLESLPTWEHWAEDLTAVLDAAGSDRAVIFASADAGPWGLLFAASSPDRTRALILWNSYAKSVASEDYPIGMPPEASETLIDMLEQLWGSTSLVSIVDPQLVDDPYSLELGARLQRFACTPATAAAQARFSGLMDARPVLEAIQAPTLVMHNENEILPAPLGRYVADQIEGAVFVPLPGRGVTIWMSETDADEIIDHVEQFVTGIRPPSRVDRVLATVLFTDLVSSTERAAESGDRRWKEVLDRHDKITRSVVGEAGGRVVNTTGDGVLATFDGPGKAIRCAGELREALAKHSLEIYAGLHTGEIELRGEQDIGGIAVHIAARVMGVAAPGEIVCSRTVKDLVVGSGIEFEDRGMHSLKGVPDEWQLFAVRAD